MGFEIGDLLIQGDESRPPGSSRAILFVIRKAGRFKPSFLILGRFIYDQYLKKSAIIYKRYQDLYNTNDIKKITPGERKLIYKAMSKKPQFKRKIIDFLF